MTDNAVSKGFPAYISELRKRALARQIHPKVFDAAMRTAEFLPEVLDKQSNQAEFTRPIWDYLDRAVSKDRIRQGRKASRANRDLLNRIESRFGVEASVVLAFWGLESAYGQHLGTFSVVSTLATLAHGGKRAAFFEDELIAALRIIQTGDATAQHMLGSWAGAMGPGQFMPSSFLDFAVDFDGDGRRDIWGDDPTDALASIANYVAKHGWKKGQPWGIEVTLPGGFDYALTGLGQTLTSGEWRGLGLATALGSPLGDYGPASVLVPAGAGGAAFLVFHNFHVILRYNNAEAYALAVGHLADRISGGKKFVASWPRDTRALQRREMRELQLLLTDAGFDTHGADGLTGPNTLAAIRGYQMARGMVADGYAGAGLLDHLRASQG